jgi:FlaA1/EpsC-like NDP-sugar epimerase
MNQFLAPLFDLSRPSKQVLQLAADLVLIVVCFALAMVLRLESLRFASDPWVWLALAPAAVAGLAAFTAMGLYRTIVRHISGEVLRIVLTGVVVTAVVLSASAAILAAPVPRSVPGIFALLLLAAVIGVRFFIRVLIRRPEQRNREPVIVYGAGEAGRQVVNALHHGREYLPVAFLDDDPALEGTILGGRRVHAPTAAAGLLARTGAKTILLAMPSIDRARRREIVTSLEPLGVEVKTVPGIVDLVTGRATVSDMRRVSPEDLLGRDPVPPRESLMARNIDGKVVLVTGAGGSIGSELCRQIAARSPAALILLDVSEYALFSIQLELREILDRSGRELVIEPLLGSVLNGARMRAILREFGVQTIYHAAAYKHVVLVEENVVEGVRNNVLGTRTMAQAAAEAGVENFILISTDKAVRPTSMMGASKRLAELVCQAQAMAGGQTCFSMVRFGNVLGSSGSVIPRFRAQIERGGPVTVTDRNVTRYFMTIPEASQLVIQAGAMARGGEVFVLDMGEPVRILDMAMTMVRLYGLKPYVLDKGEAPDPARGDIAIKITKLEKGEKPYEELLIGENPAPTEHARIMSATEVALDPVALADLLARLEAALDATDLPAIRRLCLEAPLGYRPNDAQLHDRLWLAARRRGATDAAAE